NACMMGDGAGAFVMRAFDADETPYGFELLYTKLNSIGVGQSPGIYVPAGGSLAPVSHEVLDRGEHFHKQDFRRILAHGPELYVRGINDALAALRVSIADIDVIVPHQANGKVAEIGKALGFDDRKV